MTSDEAIHNSTKTTIEGKIIPIGFWNIFFSIAKKYFHYFTQLYEAKKKLFEEKEISISNSNFIKIYTQGEL